MDGISDHMPPSQVALGAHRSYITRPPHGVGAQQLREGETPSSCSNLAPSRVQPMQPWWAPWGHLECLTPGRLRPGTLPSYGYGGYLTEWPSI